MCNRSLFPLLFQTQNLLHIIQSHLNICTYIISLKLQNLIILAAKLFFVTHFFLNDPPFAAALKSLLIHFLNTGRKIQTHPIKPSCKIGEIMQIDITSMSNLAAKQVNDTDGHQQYVNWFLPEWFWDSVIFLTQVLIL